LEKPYSVFVTRGDTLAVQVPVELGLEQGDRVEIKGEIKKGDQIIITGQTALEDQAAIKIAGKEKFQPKKGKTLATGDSSQVGMPDKAQGEKPAKRGN